MREEEKERWSAEREREGERKSIVSNSDVEQEVGLLTH